MSVSYLLSGHWPYYTGVAHPDEHLQQRLQNEGSHTSIVEQVRALVFVCSYVYQCQMINCRTQELFVTEALSYPQWILMQSISNMVYM